jgi:hypothetical protein
VRGAELGLRGPSRLAVYRLPQYGASEKLFKRNLFLPSPAERILYEISEKIFRRRAFFWRKFWRLSP